MKIYLSGPMTGIEDSNFPAFHDWAKRLRDLGYEVESPAEMQSQKSWEDYLRQDIVVILECDAIAVMPGHDTSKGSAVECTVGTAIGLPVYDVRDLVDEDFPAAEPMKIEIQPLVERVEVEDETILQEAQRLVHGDRGADYGHPLDDFAKTALIWSAVLGVDVQPEQVALCMVGVKISREVNKPKRDNRVDGCGYFETLDMVYEEKARRAAAG